jgi:trk system potassium uptake protein TrkA
MEFTDTKAWAQDLGIDAMISPERSVARQIEALLAVSSAVEAADLRGGKAGIYAFRVAEGSPLAGIQLKELTTRMPNLKSMMVYIKRDGKGVVPSGDSWVQPGDLCYMVALKEHIWDVEQAFQLKKSESLRRVVSAGGGKTGFQVARRLEARAGQRVDIRLIEKDLEKCEKLAEELDRTVVLHGDAADESLLRAEGIDRANGFVATTASDEVNILLAVLAKALGARKSIALVRRKSFANLDRYIALDAVVNPTEALASAILGFVRYPSAEGGLATLGKIRAEMLEVEISSGSPSEGKRVRDLDLSPGATLALGIRGSDVFVPKGDSFVRAGDRYLLFSTEEKMSQAIQILGVN